MMPDELRAALRDLGLDQAGLAEVLGVHRNSVSNWLRGAYPIPEYVHAYCTAQAEIRWQRRKLDAWRTLSEKP
jgi:transcriptional regulator with XRE-family HTH domain